MDVRVLGPLEASVDGRAVAARRRQAARAAGDARPQRGLDGLERALDRRALGRAAAGDGDEAGAGLRVAAAQGAGRGRRRRRDRHARARLRAAARPGDRRRGAIRAAGRARARRARRSRCGAARRSTTSPTSRSRPRRSAGSRSCGSRRSSSRSSPTWTRAATAMWSASSSASSPRSRCASGCTRSGCWRCIAAGGRPTRWTPTGRRGRRWSSDRRRAGAGAAAAARGDPAPGPVARARRRPRPSSCRRSSTPRPRWSGREAELEWLREQWRSAHGGAGRLVLITGARGIGKTRLAAELAGEVHRDRGAVLYASGAGAPDAALAALADARTAHGGPRCWCSTTSTVRATRCARALDELAARAGRAARARAGDGRGRRRARPGCASTRRCASSRSTPRRCSPWRGCTRGRARTPRCRSSGSSRRAAASRSACTASRREWARTEAARRLGAAADRAAAERPGLRAAEDDLAGDIVELQALRERAEPRDRDAGVVACPFKGLASFEVDDAEFFFGRERLVAEMVARLAGAPLMAIVGRSGSGKSSALRAGLLPALAAGVLPGSEALAARARCVRASIRCARSSRRPPALAPRGRLIIAVDQFEEVFTACRDEGERSGVRRRARRRDARRAPARARARGGPRGLLRPLRRLSGAGDVCWAPTTCSSARCAATSCAARSSCPAQRAGLRVEPDLVDALIADVEGEPGALPLLSTSLLELWQQRDGRRLRLRRLRQAGGVHGAVARLAERAYERLDPDAPGRRAADPAAPRGRGRGRRRRAPARAAGRARGRRCRRGPLACWPTSASSRSARARSRSPTRRCCASGRACAAWLEDDAQGRRLHHQLSAAAREWDAGGRDPGELYRGARLAAALDWAAEHEPELNAIERALPRRRAAPRASAPSAACAPRSPASPRCSCSR